MGQMDIALRHSQEMTGLIRSHGHLERPAVCHPHIFTGETDQTPRDIERILSTFQHPHHPVDGSIRITVAHGFMEGRDQIIMLLS